MYSDEWAIWVLFDTPLFPSGNSVYLSRLLDTAVLLNANILYAINSEHRISAHKRTHTGNYHPGFACENHPSVREVIVWFQFSGDGLSQELPIAVNTKNLAPSLGQGNFKTVTVAHTLIRSSKQDVLLTKDVTHV